MSVAYTKADSDDPVATIYAGPSPEAGSTIYSIEEGRSIPRSHVRAQVALSDMHSFGGPIFAEAGQHGYPESFDDVRALCRYVIRSGGKVVIPTVK